MVDILWSAYSFPLRLAYGYWYYLVFLDFPLIFFTSIHCYGLFSLVIPLLFLTGLYLYEEPIISSTIPLTVFGGVCLLWPVVG